MFFASSLTFGIILLFRASLAQSAPHMYPDVDEDEEALIDRLASLAAAVGPETLSRQMFSNYDLPQLGGYLGDANGDMLAKESLASLPRQFAYRPDDARFYIPAEQFPTYYPQEKAETFRGEKETAEMNFNLHSQGERLPQTDHSSDDVTFSKIPPADLVFMKKNQPKEEAIHPVHNIIADPSNLVSSGGHSVEKPFHNLYPAEPEQPFSYSDIYYIGIVAGCSAAAVIGLVGAGICWYRIHQRVKAAAEVDYPAYGVTGPSKDVSPSGGDRKLAQSAHMYHYQHQKQQMAALQKGALQGDRQGSGGSDVESEDDNDDDNDYTVYECPGLAPAGEMEVKNPLFQDEPTPATPQQMKPEEEK